MNLVEQIFQCDASVQELYFRAKAEREETGSVSAETQTALDLARRDREGLLSHLGGWYLATEAKLKGLRAMYQPIFEKMESDIAELENTLDFVKSCMAEVLPKDENAQIANDRVYCYYRRSERIHVSNPDAVPFDDCRIKYEPDKEAIERRLRAGESLAYAELVESWNLQIKPGGERAVKNGKARLKKLAKGEKDEC